MQACTDYVLFPLIYMLEAIATTRQATTGAAAEGGSQVSHVAVSTRLSRLEALAQDPMSLPVSH